MHHLSRLFFPFSPRLFFSIFTTTFFFHFHHSFFTTTFFFLFYLDFFFPFSPLLFFSIFPTSFFFLFHPDFFFPFAFTTTFFFHFHHDFFFPFAFTTTFFLPHSSLMRGGGYFFLEVVSLHASPPRTFRRTRAESQQIVVQRPLSCVQYPVLFES